MKKLALLALVLVGCDGPMDAPADAEACAHYPLQATQLECTYQGIPAGVKCEDVRAYVDGEPLSSDTYEVLCFGGRVHVISGECPNAESVSVTVGCNR